MQTTQTEARKQFEKHTHQHKLVQFCIKALWTDEAKFNFNQNDGRNDSRPKAATSSVKHGAGFLMVWACTVWSWHTGIYWWVHCWRSSGMNAGVARCVKSHPMTFRHSAGQRSETYGQSKKKDAEHPGVVRRPYHIHFSGLNMKYDDFIWPSCLTWPQSPSLLLACRDESFMAHNCAVFVLVSALSSTLSPATVGCGFFSVKALINQAYLPTRWWT